uniref:GST N-terminal domain-containing protein n=1 Tax=Solanum lycopersicum TaxID=4081 RepID=A0A3Q7E864_SOLLC
MVVHVCCMKIVYFSFLLIWMFMGIFFYSDRSVKHLLPPSLDSTSQPPSLFDGTTRLYMNYQCPYSQHVWITRNVKGLQDMIKLVPINQQNRPDWYKEKVYPKNKVPSLKHNNKVIRESLVLVKYVDCNFEGPSFMPDKYTDLSQMMHGNWLVRIDHVFVETHHVLFVKCFLCKLTVLTLVLGAQFDYLEKALHKFDDGPFFLGQFSQGFNYDITTERPKLAKWIEEMNNLDGYKQTKVLEQEKMVEYYKNRFLPKA